MSINSFLAPAEYSPTKTKRFKFEHAFLCHADDLPIAEVPDNEKLDDQDELSDEEDSNELTDGSTREMPFLAKQAPKTDGRTMKRASTFANFARTSLLPVTAGEEGNLPAGILTYYS